MSIRPVIQYPDPRLHQPSAEVEHFDAALRSLVQDLEETLRASGGIGLSAPQIGELCRVAVLDLSEDRAAPEVYVNPVLIERRMTGFVQESCLSLPGVEGSVMRSVQVRVRAQDLDGQSFERELEFLHACAMQHEIDHLDGRLFVDRFFPLGRWRFRRGVGARLRRQAEGALA